MIRRALADPLALVLAVLLLVAYCVALALAPEPALTHQLEPPNYVVAPVVTGVVPVDPPPKVPGSVHDRRDEAPAFVSTAPVTPLGGDAVRMSNKADALTDWLVVLLLFVAFVLWVARPVFRRTPDDVEYPDDEPSPVLARWRRPPG